MREFRGSAKGAVASPFSVKYCFKRFLSKINAGINIVGNCTSPHFWIFWSPTPLSSEGIKGVKKSCCDEVNRRPLSTSFYCLLLCTLSSIFVPWKKIATTPCGYPVWRLPRLSVSFFGLAFFHWAIGVYQKPRDSWAPVVYKINVWGYTQYGNLAIFVGVTIPGVTITQRTYTFNCRETGARAKIAP